MNRLDALPSFLDPRGLRGAAVLAGLGAAATVGGALIFETYGYAPCKLCLEQRYAYYAAVPLALVIAILAAPQVKLARLIFLVLAALFAFNALFGVYHAGVEWGFWLGPSDCSPVGGAGAISGGSLLQQMQKARVVSCTEPALRILGLSLAGWNAVICACLALWSLRGALLRRGV